MFTTGGTRLWVWQNGSLMTPVLLRIASFINFSFLMHVDKLQEDVSSTIRALTEAHIIVWLLTGDKRETAITIAKAAGLIQCPNTLIDLTKTGPRELEARMENYSKKKKDDNRVLIIDGAAVAHIMKWEKLKKKLYSLSSSCRTVIASRLSPIQKVE